MTYWIYISYDGIKKLIAINTNFEFTRMFHVLQSLALQHLQNTEAWASNSSMSFSSSSPHFSSLFYSACLFYSDLQSPPSYRKFLPTNRLNLKDCNYSLPRNLASTTKFHCLIYTRSELFILSDYLTISDLLQTLTKSVDLIMDQGVINISNTPP